MKGGVAMSLSAERVAIANRAIRQTVEQVSIAWQAVPHWDTGDPGQILVRNDVTFAIANVAAPPVPQPGATPFGAEPIPLDTCHVPFTMTLAQATAPTPDALLAAVIPRTVHLAQLLDDRVLAALSAKAASAPALGKADSPWYRPPDPSRDGNLLNLLYGRQLLEDSGYRAPSCLIVSMAHFHDIAMAEWWGAEKLVTNEFNSLHRATQLDKVPGADGRDLMLMLGRRNRIAPGGAGAASPGEEPVDFAISVPPSLEVIGEDAAGAIQLAVRIRFATRVKDERGVVVFHSP